MGRYKQPFSLYKRGKYWYFRTYGPDGVRTAGISTGQTSKIAALNFCNELYKADKLYYIKKTFGSYAAGFFDDGALWVKDRTEPLAECTLKSYRSTLKNHLLPDLSDVCLDDINYSFLKNYRLKKSEVLKPASVNQIMGVLKIIITVASRDELIRKNPFVDLGRLNVSNNRRDSFTLDEIKYICDHIGAEFKTAVILQSLCGVRVSEARAINSSLIKDIDGVYFIELDKQIIDGVDVETKLKSKRFRLIPICKGLKELINEHSIFDYNRYKRELKKLSAGFENVEARNLSSHSLRHFFISDAKAWGVLPQKIEQVAGHSLKGIEGVYTHFKPEQLTEVIDWQAERFKTLTR